jgi:hypothetical protein
MSKDENGGSNGSSLNIRIPKEWVIAVVLGGGIFGVGGWSIGSASPRAAIEDRMSKAEKKADEIVDVGRAVVAAIEKLNTTIQKDGLTARQAQESRIDVLEAELARRRR